MSQTYARRLRIAVSRNWLSHSTAIYIRCVDEIYLNKLLVHPSSAPDRTDTPMNKLNPGAFEFIPGKGLRMPDQLPERSQVPLQPLERPEQTVAPVPPPTISLNIGGNKTLPTSSLPSSSTPPGSTRFPAARIPSKSDSPAQTSVPSSKTFSTEKAKNDTAAVSSEAQAVVDQSVLEDLYGGSSYFYSFSQSMTYAFTLYVCSYS